MTRIAHLSDLHLLENHWEKRSAGRRFRLGYLSVGRRLDPGDRRRRAVNALTKARAEADHIVVTGDLTEDGMLAQFELLAEVLSEAGVEPGRVTLVPGNHDAYESPDAFERALSGPLALHAKASQPGTVTVVGGVTLVTLSTVVHQPFTRSAGRTDVAHLEALAQAAANDGGRRTVVGAQHHPPISHRGRVLNWIDGLLNHRKSRALLETYRNVHVLHGHVHRAMNQRVRGDRESRIFAPPAVVDGRVPVRIYEARDGRLVPVRPPEPARLAEAAVLL